MDISGKINIIVSTSRFDNVFIGSRSILLLVIALSVLGMQKRPLHAGKNRPPSHAAADSQSVSNLQADYGTFAVTLKTLDGKTARLSDYAGKVLLVNLWAPWCTPCRTETPGFADLYDQYHRDGFEILGIAVQTNESEVRAFMEKYGTRWPVGLNDDVARAWGTYGLPDSYLFGWNGALLKHFIGYTKKEVLSPYLQDALKQRAASLGR